MIDLKIKVLSETATIPTKAHKEDACFDLYADCPNETHYDTENSKLVIKPGVAIGVGESFLFKTGISTEIPDGYYAQVYPRSGMGIKRNLRLSNSVGIIDSNYRGEWVVALYNDSNVVQFVNHGDRIAQFTIAPVLPVNIDVVNELSDSDRGGGGLGSSGT